MVDVDEYLTRFNTALDLYRSNNNEVALAEIQWTIDAAPSTRARFNRALILLALGRWSEGLAEFVACEHHPMFMREAMFKAYNRGMQPWTGEAGKRVLLLHTHGYGDTIMMLRYIGALDADIMIDVPQPLQRLARRFASVVDVEHCEAEYYCPIVHVLHWLKVTQETIDGGSYITPSRRLAAQWRCRLGDSSKQRIGIAWSSGHRIAGDYPRNIPLAQLIDALPDVELHSVQTQDAIEAQGYGIHVHDFEDFWDCAAFMTQMDRIISIDTAALHLAGAIGHPNVVGLLPYWHSWRWRAKWYRNVRLFHQSKPDDWASVLENVR